MSTSASGTSSGTGARPYHHGSVREVTLDHAQQLLESTPAHRISLREVARAAGLSHAAPYKHFAERHDFLRALAQRCMADFVAAQREALVSAPSEGPHPDADRLVALGGAYVGYGAAHPNAFALIYDPAISPPGSPPAELAPLIDEHTTMLREAVEQGIAEAALGTPAAEDTATALWATVHGLTHLVILGHVPQDRVGHVLASSLGLSAGG